jgi:hypothetical protein
MTKEQEIFLKDRYKKCERLFSNSKNINTYESYKKAIISMNLTADEYEVAIIKIAGIIGI